MSRWVYINAELDLVFSENNIIRILQSAQNNNWKFYGIDDAELSLDVASSIALGAALKEESDRIFGIKVPEEAFGFSLNFFKTTDGNINVSMMNFDYEPQVPFYYEIQGIDYYRFSQYMLRLVEPFILISIEADWI